MEELLKEVMEMRDTHSMSDLSDMTIKEFFDEFMEPGDILSKIIAQEAQEVESLSLSLMKVDSKEDDHIKFYHFVKKPTSVVQHDVHPIDHIDVPFHLRLGNLLSGGTYHCYHPHLNLSVGKYSIIFCE